LSFKSIADIELLKKSVAEGKNPRDVKLAFAKEIVSRFHDNAAAEQAVQNFINRFSKGQLPEDIPEHEYAIEEKEISVAQLLKQLALVKSTSDGLRMIQQGGVRLDNEKIADPQLKVAKGSHHLYQIGKRTFARIKVI
jgi:tyrosyl-tRNA synthetase